MSDDRRRPAQYDAEREAILKRWLADEVRPFSAHWRSILDRAGSSNGRASAVGRITSLPTIGFDDIGDGRQLVLVATPDALAKHATLPTRVRSWSTLVNGRDALQRRILDPTFKPVMWTTSGPAFVASSEADLDELGTLGRRALDFAGVKASDRVLVVSPAGSGVAAWQLVLGCRNAGVAILHLDLAEPDVVASSGATVVAGRLDDLLGCVDDLPAAVTTCIVLADDQPPSPDELSELADGRRVVTVWWTPPGARAAWATCGGIAEGFHTWPLNELVEVVDGELVWSAVGWRGSVWLRLRTGVAGRVETAACPRCGRTTPRFVPEVAPAPVAVPADQLAEIAAADEAPAAGETESQSEPVADAAAGDDEELDEGDAGQGLDEENADEEGAVAIDEDEDEDADEWARFDVLSDDEAIRDWLVVALIDGDDVRPLVFLRPEQRAGSAELRDAWADDFDCEVLLIGAKRLETVRAALDEDGAITTKRLAAALRT